MVATDAGWMAGRSLPGAGEASSMPRPPLTDREQVLAWQEEHETETQAVQQAIHYKALGVGLALFCQTMLAVLLAPDGEGPLLSRDEALRLVTAAVQGR